VRAGPRCSGGWPSSTGGCPHGAGGPHCPGGGYPTNRGQLPAGHPGGRPGRVPGDSHTVAASPGDEWRSHVVEVPHSRVEACDDQSRLLQHGQGGLEVEHTRPPRRRPPRGRDQPGSASSPGKAAHPSVADRLSQTSSGSCFRRRARCRLGARCQTAVAQPVRKDLAAEGPVHEERGCRPQAQAAAARTRRRASSSSETSSPSSVATSSGVTPAQTRATLRLCDSARLPRASTLSNGARATCVYSPLPLVMVPREPVRRRSAQPGEGVTRSGAM